MISSDDNSSRADESPAPENRPDNDEATESAESNESTEPSVVQQTQEAPVQPSKPQTVQPSKQQLVRLRTPRPSPSTQGTMTQKEHFVRIKQMVKKAIAAKHTFMIIGESPVVREALLKRGWLERYSKRIYPGDELLLNIDSNPSALLVGIGSLNQRQNERILIHRMLSSHTVDFLWVAGSDRSCWPTSDNKNTIFNRFAWANFTSKVGLCANVRQMYWYYETGVANTQFPRCYNISQPDQTNAFVEDFRMTACLSLLKWLVDKWKNDNETALVASNGTVPLRALEFAIGRCGDFIGIMSHEDIDQEPEKTKPHQWEQFINWYYKIVHSHEPFVANTVPVRKYVQAAQHLLKQAKKYWPQLDMDGSQNVWIVKPGNNSCGRGIVIMNKLDDILIKVNPSNKKNHNIRYVIQKYIERPLLIHDTKFDIRQWFIITSAKPLTLWMYRQSYLRFCSQRFSLTDFHESIHLSNHAVQRKYKKTPNRDPSLPSENMWDIATFKKYLLNRGNGDAWDKLIYPGMKQGLVGSLLASQDWMDRRQNSFEFYGADFMVMEDFSVWLIEIQMKPDLSNTTSVTTRLCRKAIEDTIKVVVDYRENPNADTGDFELVYKQKLTPSQTCLDTECSLQGTPIYLGDKHLNSESTNSMGALSKRKLATREPVRVGPLLVDLIEKLELQLDNEFYEYLRSTRSLARQNLPLPLSPALTSSENDDPTKPFN